MAHRWRMGISGLLVCTLVLGGCGDDSASQTVAPDGATQKVAVANVPAEAGVEPPAMSAEPLSVAPAIVMLGDAPVVRVAVPASGQVLKPALAENFHARIVEVTYLSEAAKLPDDERAAARARAFGLEWGGRTHEEIKSLLHCKSQVRGCSSSYGTYYYYPGISGLTFRSTARGHRDSDEKTPYSVSLEFLGSRDGKDHFLLTLTLEESASVAPPEGGAPTETFNLFAEAQSGFISIHETYHEDGSVDVKRTREVSYEVVYSGEPFYLKLADRMLFGFGVQDRERTEEYRPCPFCALSEEMEVDELRLASAVAPRQSG